MTEVSTTDESHQKWADDLSGCEAYDSPESSKPITSIPYRQIRAHFDETTITVYQAYSAEIAIAAQANQRLSASPAFKLDRMTWIKPSFMWAMYRSGFSYKDSRQAHILALRLPRTYFEGLLAQASVNNAGHAALTAEERERAIRVQWDPERSVTLEKLPYRSIQIGIGREVVQEWVKEIVQIVDVTERARKMKSLLDEGNVAEAEKLVPREKAYPLSDKLQELLQCTVHTQMDE